MTEDVLALIPARGGSKGLYQKNIRNLCGRPLITYSIDAGLESSSVDRVVVSSDNEAIRSIADDHGADVPFERPDELATDDAPTAPVVVHALDWFDREAAKSYETVVLLQPTSPLRTSDHVDDALEQFERTEADSLLSVYPTYSHRWERTDGGAKRLNYTGKRKRRQEKEPEYVENGAIYVVDANQFREEKDFSVGKTVLYEMDESTSVDIDNETDMAIAECLLSEGPR